MVISLPVYRDDKNIKFLFLPDDHDPDTFVKAHGQQAFQDQLDRSLSLSNFLLKKLKQKIDLTSIDGRAQFIDKSKVFIKELPKGQFRKLLMEEVSLITKTKVDFSLNQKQTRIQSINQWTPIRKNHCHSVRSAKFSC